MQLQTLNSIWDLEFEIWDLFFKSAIPNLHIRNQNMPSQIQIYTDENGNKTSVIVPYEDWAKMNARLRALQDKLKIFSGIREGMQEVKEARKANRELQNLADFINESRS